MVETKSSRFVEESFEVLMVSERRLEEFDGDRTVRASILGLVDLTEGAATSLVQQAIVADVLAAAILGVLHCEPLCLLFSVLLTPFRPQKGLQGRYSKSIPYFEEKHNPVKHMINEEEVDLSEYEDYTDATRQLGHFLDEVSMHKRIHSSLGYVTLAEFEEDWRRKPPPVPVEQERETESHQRKEERMTDEPIRVGDWLLEVDIEATR